MAKVVCWACQPNLRALPLHMLQAEVMKRRRAAGEAAARHDQALMVTIAGIAAGLRNTG